VQVGCGEKVQTQISRAFAPMEKEVTIDLPGAPADMETAALMAFEGDEKHTMGKRESGRKRLKKTGKMKVHKTQRPCSNKTATRRDAPNWEDQKTLWGRSGNNESSQNAWTPSCILTPGYEGEHRRADLIENEEKRKVAAPCGEGSRGENPHCRYETKKTIRIDPNPGPSPRARLNQRLPHLHL